jgi:hypothetical protein
VRRGLVAPVAVAAVAALPAAVFLRLPRPVEGGDLDADTGRPLAGAAVRLDTSIACPRLGHGSDGHAAPPLARPLTTGS